MAQRLCYTKPMKRALARAQGYTIIETLIFLAITGSLFVTVAILITGQQHKTEFNQGVRDLESSMQDISNDIATGYYANTNNFSCSATNTSGVRPIISSAVTNNQGSNSGCTFIGKVVQFAPSDANKSTYKIYTVVGKQKYNNNDASNLGEAMPTAIYPVSGSIGVPDGSDTKTISGGVTAEWVKYVNNSVSSPAINAFGFFTSFGNLSGSTGTLSGTQDVQLIPVPNTGSTADQTASSINGMNSGGLVINPTDGIQVCLQSNGSPSQYAIMTIGGNGRSTSVNLAYNNGGCPAL